MVKNIIYSILIILLLNNTCFSNENSFENNFSDEIKIIGCINSKTLETSNTINGNCLYGKNLQNIMLPKKDDLYVYYNVFGNDIRKIINSMPTENIESGFNENAENKYAIGYVQTLKKWNISKDIYSQLVWKKERQDNQKKNINQCGKYKKEDNIIKCLYRYHYNSKTGYFYSEKSMKIRDFYYKYFKI